MLETEDAAALDDAASTERKMRRALGLDGPGRQGTLTIQAGSPKRVTGELATSRRSRQEPDATSDGAHRANNGSPLQARVETLQQQFAAERQRHGEARQLLGQAELKLRSFEERLREGVLAQAEELEAARRATANAQRALDEVLFDTARQREVQPSTRASKLAAPPEALMGHAPNTLVTTELAMVATASPPSKDPALKKRGRPRTRPIPEPKPVRWWIPSYKAKAKG